MVAIVVGIFFLMNLKTSQISIKEAQNKIMEITEVREYIQTLSDAGSVTQFVVEDLGDEWNVHVFEIVKNGDISHTATFGWYRVDKNTGEVNRDL